MIHTEKTPGQVLVKQVVMDVMEDLGIEQKWYKNLVRWAVNGYSELSMVHLDVFEECKLTPSDLNVYTVPADYVNWVAIGIPWNNRFWTVSRDNKLITTTTTNPDTGVEEFDSTVGEGEPIGDRSYWAYGESGGKNQYKLEWINSRQFVINGTPKTNVIMRYVSSGINATGESYIPVMAAKAVKAYVKLRWVERDEKSYNKMMFYQDQYDRALDELRFVQMGSVEDMMDAVYEAWTQTVRR